jgi:hypothetical protein
MKKNLCLASAIFFLAGVLTAPGADFWEKKPYKDWSQKDCAKLLENSPWARAETLTSVGIMDNQLNKTSTDGQQPFVKYQIQFNSAKPIREAIVRQAQIAQKYDGLSPEQKQEMDKRAEAFLSADFTNFVVVSVTYSTNNRNYDLELARHWQSQTADLLKNVVNISNSKGEKIYLTRYSAEQGAGRSFQFIFPRQIDGKPLIGPDDKSIKLEFTYPVVGSMGSGKAFMEFKVNKMMFDGSAAY